MAPQGVVTVEVTWGKVSLAPSVVTPGLWSVLSQAVLSCSVLCCGPPCLSWGLLAAPGTWVREGLAVITGIDDTGIEDTGLVSVPFWGRLQREDVSQCLEGQEVVGSWRAMSRVLFYGFVLFSLRQANIVPGNPPAGAAQPSWSPVFAKPGLPAWLHLCLVSAAAGSGPNEVFCLLGGPLCLVSRWAGTRPALGESSCDSSGHWGGTGPGGGLSRMPCVRLLYIAGRFPWNPG